MRNVRVVCNLLKFVVFMCEGLGLLSNGQLFIYVHVFNIVTDLLSSKLVGKTVN